MNQKQSTEEAKEVALGTKEERKRGEGGKERKMKH
jgi:hypothetical protein